MTYWGLVAAAVSQVIIGFLWYGPLFGNTWMKLTGMKRPAKMTPEIKKRMTWSYVWSVVSAFVTAYILKIVLLKFQFATFGGVAFVMFLIWLGFNVPVLLSNVLWEGRSAKLFALSTLYYLVSYIVMAWILLLNI